MRLVDAATFAPGCCVLGGGHEKLVDFERTMPAIRRDAPMFDQEGDRMYVSQQMIADAARLMGFKGPGEQAELERKLAAAAARVKQLEDVEGELADLRAAVRATLDAGATVDQRTDEKKLRLPRGVTRERLGV